MPRAKPQIEVTYDIDANGILNVTAEEKSSGRKSAITITNDKGRMSKAEIERLVKEAESFATQDREMRDRMEARGTLENLCYSLRETLGEHSARLENDDKDKIGVAIKDALNWLEATQTEEKETYDAKVKELEAVYQPILTKMYAELHAQKTSTPAEGAEGGAEGAEHSHAGAEGGMPGMGGEH
jgi:L1 cell adhesion molecule like protein